ncbi:MAG: hypothetical protein ACRDQ7_21030 [Haloechinothrix sp.]
MAVVTSRLRASVGFGRLGEVEQWGLVREGLARSLPDDSLPAAPALGGYWTRTNDVEIDIVGADRAPVARQLLFVGSIKWLDRSPFDDHDLADLLGHRAALTTEPIPTVAVSRSGISCHGLRAAYGPEDLIAAWARTAG